MIQHAKHFSAFEITHVNTFTEKKLPPLFSKSSPKTSRMTERRSG
jgi:hypothetical protein